MVLMVEKVGRYRRNLYVFFAVLVVLSICITSYLREGAIRWPKSNYDSSLPLPQESEVGKLEHVLKKAAMNDRTVILVVLNEAWAKPNSIFDVFLDSFRIGEQTQSLLKHIVVIAIDQKSINRCKKMNLHCYFLTIDGMSSTSSEKSFMSKDYVTLIWERLRFFGKVLELGYSFLLTDVDIVWFRRPLKHFFPTDDITVACDRFTGNSSDPKNKANVGFIHVNSNNRTISFYKHWYEMRSRFPNQLTQAVFDKIKTGEFAKRLGLRIRFLDTAIFGGFCEHGKDLNKLHTLHANCCVGLRFKIYDLRIILNVWRKFSHLPKDKKNKGIRWRAPIKCRMSYVRKIRMG